jgi:pyruvate dehydrogenase E2 component (dihydrolipoamide acetyltransferase)
MVAVSNSKGLWFTGDNAGETAMTQVLVMPRQGNTVESCLLTAWRVEENAAVRPDQVVCEVETDKASFDVEAGTEGVLLKRLYAEGDDVPVLAPIAVIGMPGEDWRAAVAQDAGQAQAADAGEPPSGAGLPPLLPGASDVRPGPEAGPQRISPRARGLAEAAAVSTVALQGTGPEGRIIQRDVEAAIRERPALTAAARAAAATGASIPAHGTALGGRVGLADLAGPAVEPAPSQRESASPAPGASSGGHGETPLKGIRRIIADRMRSSLTTTAQLTFNGSAPADRLLALRNRFKASDPQRGLAEVTVGDLVNYVVAQVVPRFPALNAHLVDGTLRTFDQLNLGVAVDTPRGLLVPVIRNAGGLSLAALSSETKRLAAACIAGTVKPEELTGGTFTVSNLGALGVESFTPVLNAPEVGILGVSAIVPRPVLGPDGTVKIELRIGLSLTIDHQVIDGAPAARILKAFADGIGDIDLLSWGR